MKRDPVFSVIMPVFNGELFVGQAIESVLGQTFRDWEFVIVDDCSTDRTPAILAEYAAKDSRIKVIRNPEKSKVSQSLNRGIAQASGRWLAHIDADDFFDIDYLEKLEPYTRKPGADYFCSSWVNVVDEYGIKILDIELPKAEKIQRMIKIENFLYHSATSFSKALWEKVGGYPEEVTLAENVAL